MRALLCNNQKKKLYLFFYNLTILLFFLISNLFLTPLSAQNSEQQTKVEELVFASWDGDIDKIKSLVSEGIDINAQIGLGLTALHCAKLRGNSTILEWLLKNDANPNIKIPDKNQIADIIFQRKVTPNSPGGTLVMIQNGSIIHKSCYGMANIEHNGAITPTTDFEIASVTKQFVGFAIATLVQQGKISLNDNIRKYIPELNDFDHTLTISHLLHHTSGLRDWPGSLCLAGWNLDDVISNDHILAMAFNQKGLNFEPGSEFLYSNTGYTLMVELVQRVTGKTFRKWIESNVLQPIEMTNSHYHDDRTELLSGKAYGYQLGRDNKYKALPYNFVALGSGSLHSNIEDMAKWAINLDNHKVGGEAVFNLMYQQGILNNGEKVPYASGLEIKDYRGTKTIGHGGGGSGYTTLIMYFPEHHFSAVVLYNINSDVYRTIFDITDVYLGEKLESKQEINKDESMNKNVAISDDKLEKYLGTYKVFPAFYITITSDGNQLMALETNKEIYPISALSETEFWLPAWNQSLKFTVDDSGSVSEFYFLGRKCPKIEEGNAPSQLPLTEDLTGDYYSAELDVRYSISIENDQLVAKHRRHGTANLTPAWREDFRCDWWFMRSVEFDRDKQGNIEGLTVNQWQSRNHKFIKLKGE